VGYICLLCMIFWLSPCHPPPSSAYLSYLTSESHAMHARPQLHAPPSEVIYVAIIHSSVSTSTHLHTYTYSANTTRTRHVNSTQLAV
jgi:hypothetical protein